MYWPAPTAMLSPTTAQDGLALAAVASPRSINAITIDRDSTATIEPLRVLRFEARRVHNNPPRFRSFQGAVTRGDVGLVGDAFLP
jgi:hypothetical protein